MDRSRVALAVLATVWLGLASMVGADGGQHALERSRLVDASVDHLGAVVPDAVRALPERQLDEWSTRANPVRLPLAVALVLLVVQLAGGRWAPRPLKPQGDAGRHTARATAPRAPPA